MTLTELKQTVDDAIEKAREFGESPDEIIVSIQIDACGEDGDCTFTDCTTDVEMVYDGNATASGCVIVGVSK
jgi:hypothetical protein